MSLTLRLVPPSGGEATSLTVDKGVFGRDLMSRVEEVLKVPTDSQLLFFQNGSRNAAKRVVDAEKALTDLGVEDGATITVRVNDKAVLPQDSVLRQSISKNGTSSYYYAHANEKELPHEHRYVEGGEPARLVGHEGHITQLVPTRVIEKYSWADEGDFICIYVSGEGESEALLAAKDGKNNEVEVNFDSKSFELLIHGEKRRFALAVPVLENEILPEDSKFRVSAGKRVTLKMKKKKKVTWTRLAKPK